MIGNREVEPPHTLVGSSDSERLEGWKQIAGYLKCGERTAQRWEKKGLPVRRHETLGTVQAYKSVLDSWKKTILVDADHDTLHSAIEYIPPAPRIRCFENRVLVGRNAEMNGLRQHLKLAVSGCGRVLCVIAEPGVGKTALVEVFLQCESARQGVLTATGRCRQELEHSEPYLPWLEALDELTSNDESIETLLHTAAPTWWNQLRLRRPHSHLREASTVKRELLRFLQGLTDRTPVVLFIDDLHWADRSTVDFIAYLGSSLPAMRLLLVAAYRHSDLVIRTSPFLQIEPELKMHKACEDLHLSELTLQDTECYIDLRFPGHLFPAETMRWLHGRSSGNPLCLTDMLEHSVGRGWILFEDGRWRQSGDPSNWGADLPQSVSGMVAKKLAELPDDDRDLLRAASIQGAEFDSAVLSSALALDGVLLEDRLARLENTHRLLRGAGEATLLDGRQTRRYRFAHVLYREALLDTLGPAERRGLCRSIADAIINVHVDEGQSIAANVARLLEDAGANERALKYYFLAATNAVRISAYRQAFDLARHAGEIALRAGRTEMTARAEMEFLTLQALCASCLQGSGAAEIERIYGHARQVSRELGDESAATGVGYMHWGFLASTDLRRARVVADTLFKKAKASGKPAIMALAGMANGITSIQRGEAVAATATLLAADRQWQRHQEHLTFRDYPIHPPVVTLCSLARALWFGGQPDQALRASSRAVRLALAVGHERTTAYALAMAANIAHLRRDAPGTLVWADKAVALATEHELPYELTWARALRAWALAATGEGNKAISIFEECLSRYRGPAATKLLCHYAEALGTNGSMAEASRVLDDAFKLAARNGECYYESELLRIRARHLLVRPGLKRADIERAAQLFKKAWATARRRKAKSHALRAASSLFQFSLEFRPRMARNSVARLTRVVDEFPKGLQTPDLLEAQALLQEYGGR